MAKMNKKMMPFEKKDMAMDKKRGIKENSKVDLKKDAMAMKSAPKGKKAMPAFMKKGMK